MLKLLLARFQQGHRTAQYPEMPPTLPDRWRGGPSIDRGKCPVGCFECGDTCPTDALRIQSGHLGLDMGRCLFCTECMQSCPHGAITFTQEYRLAARKREALVVEGKVEPREKLLDEKLRRLFGRSLKLRQVSAGGCNGCESDVNVLGTIVFDLGRFGIQMVASPRHADGLLITGPVTENMKLALKKTYDAVPEPKIVIAVGACAISGGPYIDHPEVHNGADSVVPVDLYVPGCPPHPFTILDGLLGMLGRLESEPAWMARFRETGERIAAENLEAMKTWDLPRAEEAVKYLGADLRHAPPAPKDPLPVEKPRS
ncbi:NADH-quinone oxidoreductase subunit NuoB [Pendulispora brunnea]|uniref:NADH-quinone oxidoreductase subunit NuoB n=1 Tax=Pendulispora brunnea TaxID=2905690 RepID=A0ABZ2JYW5_9BACT